MRSDGYGGGGGGSVGGGGGGFMGPQYSASLMRARSNSTGGDSMVRQGFQITAFVPSLVYDI